MNEPNEGQVNPDPAVLGQGQQETQPAQVDNSIVNQYLAEQPATQPAPTDGQAQGQVNTNTQGIPETDAYKNLQSIYNKTVAEKLAIERQFQLMQQQIQQPQQTAQNTNPYDPNADWVNWLRAENKLQAEQVAQATMQKVIGFAEQQSKLQQEVQWQQSHPEIDINQVKNFAQQRGIANLDDAYTILTLPQRTNQVIQQTATNLNNQFRQTNTGAIPLRTNSAPAPQPVGLSYEKMATEFNNNPSVYDKWTPQMRTLFDTETFKREEARRVR